MKRLPRIAAPVMACSLLLSACGGGAPDAGAWSETWDEARAIVPGIEAFAEGPDDVLCDDVLVDLREVRDRLFPAPDPLIGEAADRWLQHAETIFFECPPETGPHVGFEAAYDELDRLRREVDSLLP